MLLLTILDKIPNFRFNVRLLRFCIYLFKERNEEKILKSYTKESKFNPGFFLTKQSRDPAYKELLALILNDNTKTYELFWESFVSSCIEQSSLTNPLNIDDLEIILKSLDSNPEYAETSDKFKAFIILNNILEVSSKGALANDIDIKAGNVHAALGKINLKIEYKNKLVNHFKGILLDAFAAIHGLIFFDGLKYLPMNTMSEEQLKYFQEKKLTKKASKDLSDKFKSLYIAKEGYLQKKYQQNKFDALSGVDILIDKLDDFILLFSSFRNKKNSSSGYINGFENVWNIHNDKKGGIAFLDQVKGIHFTFLASFRYLSSYLKAYSNLMSVSKNPLRAEELMMLVDLSTTKSIISDLKSKESGLKESFDTEPNDWLNETPRYQRKLLKGASINWKEDPQRPRYVKNESAKDWAKDSKRRYKLKEFVYKSDFNGPITFEDLKKLKNNFDKLFVDRKQRTSSIREQVRMKDEVLDFVVDERIVDVDEGDRKKLEKILDIKSVDQNESLPLQQFYTENYEIFEFLEK